MAAPARNTELASKLGRKLKELRKASGLTREQGAVFSGISYGGLEGIEGGEGFPRIDTIMRLAHLYGVTLDELVDPEDYEGLMPSSLELLGRRFAQSLPQDATAAAAGAVLPLTGKGGKGRSSTLSTAAASTIRSAASAAAAKAADTDAAPTPEVAEKPAASRKAPRSRRIQTAR